MSQVTLAGSITSLWTGTIISLCRVQGRGGWCQWVHCAGAWLGPRGLSSIPCYPGVAAPWRETCPQVSPGCTSIVLEGGR